MALHGAKNAATSHNARTGAVAHTAVVSVCMKLALA